MVAGLAVEAGTLAAGIGADHAADRGAIGGGEFRREEQAVFGQRGIELILHHAGLDAYPALVRVDLEDPVHVARDVHHKTLRQRLAVGAGSAAARCEDDVLEAGLGRDTREAHQVIDVARKHDKLGKQLIDRVVGCRDDPVAIGWGQISFEPSQTQFCGQFVMQRSRGPHIGNAWQHTVLPAWRTP